MSRAQPVPTHAPSPDQEKRLPLGTAVVFGLPTLGTSFMLLLLMIYFLKFSTDVLLLAPAVMATLFGLSRIWDAVSDPLIGYVSDRTRSRWGRRRPWMLLSALPIACFFWMLWSPPSGLGSLGLTFWMGVGVFGFFTSVTAFYVPHQALGAELSIRYHDRTRIFGLRYLGVGLGMACAMGAVGLLDEASDPRATAFAIAGIAGLTTALLILFAASRLSERPEHLGRGATSPFAAFADVGNNPHARRLLFVLLIQSLGFAMLAPMAPYYVEYVIGASGLLVRFFVFYFVPAMVLIPLWIFLSRRFGKRNVWVFALCLTALGSGSLFFLGEGDGAWLCLAAVVMGAGTGCGQIMGPSANADVIDYDEYRTGQRKEGAYSAVWSFISKAAGGIGFMVGGFALELSGYAPNVEQSQTTKLALRAMMAVLPFTCALLAALSLMRFRLTEAEHTRIRLELDRRNAGR